MNTDKIIIMFKKFYNKHVKNIVKPLNSEMETHQFIYEMTSDEKIEYDKCKNDPVYFAETYCIIMTEFNNGLKANKLTDAQRTLLQSDKDEHIMQDRQSGTTTCIVLKSLHDMIFKNKRIGIVSKRAAYSEILAKIKMCYICLPDFLQKNIKRFNMSEILFTDESNIFRITLNNFKGKIYDKIILLNNNSASAKTIKTIHESLLPIIKAMNGVIITVDDNVSIKAKSLNGNCIVFNSLN